MKFFRGFLGFFFTAIVVNSLWGVFVNNFGLLGGYISAFVLIGSMWFLNHYIGLIENDKSSAFVDMTFGIAISIVIRDSIIHGASSVISSMPTFICVSIGSVLGGIVVGVIENNIEKSTNNLKKVLKMRDLK